MKDKSISLSSIGQKCSKNILRTKTSDKKIKYSAPSMQNIIFNRLYDEHALESQHCQTSCTCNISYENETSFVNKTNFDDLMHPVKCMKKQETIDRMIEKNGRLHPEMLLFAENQAYDQLSPSEDCINSKNGLEMKALKVDGKKFNEKNPLLTGTDLLMFAKQIATGMVRYSQNMMLWYDSVITNNAIKFALLKGIFSQQ